MRYAFCGCEFDSESGQLSREGEAVALSPRAQRLLALLLERRPRPVGQRELRDALWPQTHVGYTSLAQVVTELRKAIGDQPGVDGIIRTVPRTGYAFVAELAGEGPPADAADGQRAEAVQERGARPAGRVAGKAVAFAGALLLTGILGGLLARQLEDRTPPRFSQLTFRRGVLTGARFTSDGQTVVYSALWDGRPPEVFSRRLDGSASVSLGLPPADLLSVSSRGELALRVAPAGERGVLWVGTLARVPLSGGPLRPVLERVLDADWSPDGRELAAIRWLDGRFQLEYPLGRVLLRPCQATRVRVSPGGDRVALLDPDGILVVGASGRLQRLRIPAAHQRLAWSAAGSLLVDASESDLHRTLRRVSLRGAVEEICALAGTLVLHDVSRDGRVLIHHGFERWSVRALAPGEADEHDVSVYANSQLQGLSADGERILLWDGGEGPPGAALLRPTRGGPAVRLGEGHPLGLSPDGAWVVVDRSAVPHGGLVLSPTGAGNSRPLPVEPLRAIGPFFVAADSVGFNAAEPERRPRAYRLEPDSGRRVPLTPEGTLAIPGQPAGGRTLLARGEDGTLARYSLSSGAVERLPWKLPADPFLETIGTIEDGRALLVRSGSMPARVDRLDLENGLVRPWKVLGPPDATGVGHVWTTLVTPDGRGYAYTHGLFLEDLFVVDGLRPSR